ncbi:MAG: hypothetical protein M9921_08520 [Fimbriimonadaceae bacterium]|nr:hypothetical protein [Fimbriimonadaceae bacterium]
MQSYETLSTERMSSDEAQRVAQLLSERLRDSITIDELANTMNVPRDQVAAALSQVRHGPSARPQPNTRIDSRLLIAAVAGVVLIWTIFLAGFFVSTTRVDAPATQAIEVPAGTPVNGWAAPAPELAPEVAETPPPEVAHVAPTPTR